MRFIKIIASAFLLILIALFLAIRGPSWFRGRQVDLGNNQASAEQQPNHPIANPTPSPSPETRQPEQAANESEKKTSEQTSSQEKSTETRSATRQRTKSARASIAENRRSVKIECVNLADSQCSTGRTTVVVMQPTDVDVDEESVDYEGSSAQAVYIDDFDDDNYYEYNHDYDTGYGYEEDEMEDSTAAPTHQWVILAVPKAQECPVAYDNGGDISDP